MRFELFIASRYLRSRRMHGLVALLTWIATAAVTVSIAALIFALALMNGFRAEIRDKLLQGTAHLNLLKADGSDIENYTELAQRIAQTPGVVAASATTYTPALLALSQRNEPAILKGVDLTAPAAANEVFTTTIEGNPQQLHGSSHSTDDELPGLVIGRELARALNVKLGDQLTASALGTRLTPLGLQPRARSAEFRVVGIFASGLYEYDSKWAYVTLPALQSMIGSGATAGTIQMKVQDIYAVEDIAARVLQTAGREAFVTQSWQELNRPLFSALQLQERVVVSFFSLLIVMAALSIVALLTVLVMQKRQDIAILRTQGATPRMVATIFRWQGLAIGLLGTLAGLPLGLIAIWLANRWRLIALPNEIYSISYIRLTLRLTDGLWVILFTLLVSYLATLYPVAAASRLKPVAALRMQ
ncbi:MAG: ABC transporter permease [Acidobacteria bacterium]|nr:ABC transporter permease [Acidobacteriota bacterium]